MTRNEIQAEMLRVAEALERPNLRPEQISRGKARYDFLESELMFLVQRERKEAEQRPQPHNYPPDIQATVDGVWNKLDPTGKRRRS